MPLYLDGNKVGNYLYFGNTRIEQAYLNGTLVYQMRVPFSDVEYTVPGVYEFTVPGGNKFIDVQVDAAQGNSQYNTGGLGGRVTCRIAVTGGQKLYCFVGGVPSQQMTAEYNASDIRTSWDSATGSSLNNRIVVAGAGGNAGRLDTGAHYRVAGAGGNGGYPNGNNGATAVCRNGYGYGGTGGTQSKGGTGGSYAGDHLGSRGKDGNFGLGGSGVYYAIDIVAGSGAAGGAGWYGGGGGGIGDDEKSNHTHWCGSGGGGGGSSYANSSCCSNIAYTGGVRTGNGYIKIKQVVLDS